MLEDKYGYAIDSISPARNKGKNLQEFIESKGLPWTDIEGNPRDSSPDLGAYEFTTGGGGGGGAGYNSPNYNQLYQNYPNPFNPSTKIRYSVPYTSQIQIKVFDVLGNEIGTLVNEEKSIGNFETKFDATGLPGGIYFYRIVAGEFIETKKMVLLR